MALQKIKFRDTDETNEYVVAINPDSWNPIDSTDYKLNNTIDGAPIQLISTFDQRERSFSWPSYPEDGATFNAMVVELKTYKNQKKQLNTQTIDFVNHGWKNIIVTDVKAAVPKGGQLKLSLILTYIFLDEI